MNKLVEHLLAIVLCFMLTGCSAIPSDVVVQTTNQSTIAGIQTAIQNGSIYTNGAGYIFSWTVKGGGGQAWVALDAVKQATFGLTGQAVSFSTWQEFEAWLLVNGWKVIPALDVPTAILFAVETGASWVVIPAFILPLSTDWEDITAPEVIAG